MQPSVARTVTAGQVLLDPLGPSVDGHAVLLHLAISFRRSLILGGERDRETIDPILRVRVG